MTLRLTPHTAPRLNSSTNQAKYNCCNVALAIEQVIRKDSWAVTDLGNRKSWWNKVTGALMMFRLNSEKNISASQNLLTFTTLSRLIVRSGVGTAVLSSLTKPTLISKQTLNIPSTPKCTHPAQITRPSALRFFPLGLLGAPVWWLSRAIFYTISF